MPLHDQAENDLLSFRTVTHWVRAAAVCDIDLLSILRQAGVEGLLTQPQTAEIQRVRLERIMHSCVKATWARGAGQHFPLELADTFAFDYMPDMAMFVSSAPTLRDAVKALDVVPAFFDSALQFSLTEIGEQARIAMRYTQPGELIEISYPFIETAFALCTKLSRTLQGHTENHRHISFRHAQHQGHEACENFFGKPIEYEQPVDAMWFDRAAMDRRLRGAIEVAHSSSALRLQDHAARQVVQCEDPKMGMAATLMNKMMNDPALVCLDVQAIANQLDLHHRTLQRRLKAEGSSYSAVLDQARFQLADQ
ncbi:MAG: AraC family transcriptional regulator ligand-binding domain-containing protein [Aquabacterium sp.]|nr:AraC family transcriptional regulator ligand-binding domain-containing protein [Aquabacterium sp.]